jgi:hypothetical protein
MGCRTPGILQLLWKENIKNNHKRINGIVSFDLCPRFEVLLEVLLKN